MRYIPLITALLCFHPQLHAGSPDPEIEPAKPLSSSRPLFKVTTDYVFESDFKDSRYGSQDAFRYGASLTVPFMLTDHWRLSTGLAYSRTDLGSSASPLPGKLQTANGILEIAYLINEQPAFLLHTRPGFQSAGELEADSFDSPTLLTGAIRMSESLVFVGGAIYTRFREYPVLPVAGFIWTPNDTVTVNGLLPEPGMLLKLNEKATLFVGGELAGGSYQVSDGEQYEGDSLDYIEMRGGAGLKLKFSEHCGMDIGAGWVFSRKYGYDDADRTFRLEGAPFVKMSVSASF